MPSPSPRPASATILAAGLGARMGGLPKAALEFDGRSLMEWQVDALRRAGVNSIHVVVGPYQDRLLPLIERCGARALIHAKAAPTLSDSQRLGIEGHLRHCEGQDMMLLVSDLPLLRAAHIQHLWNTWHQFGAQVLASRPVVDGIAGHPLMLRWSAVQLLGTAPPADGLRAWLGRHALQLALVACSDPAYITDLDTPADWAGLQPIATTSHGAELRPAHPRRR